MKKKLLSILLAASLITGLTTVVNTRADFLIPAFPGAEGGGMYATGGRGGTVVHVTNLNDSGPGSFREAVGTSNRIVVFDVGGTIELKSDVVVKGNVTVAGQTAPGGGGITLKNFKIGMGGDNIICRFISSRPGERGTNADYDAWGGSNGGNTIIDHCSLGWANDEQFGLYSKNDNMTVQWSVIGPSNSFSYHSKGIHGFGIMLGRSNTSWHHNMIAHNISRNFRGKVPGANASDFVNNVIYNWGYQTAYGTMGQLNYVGNYLKEGNSTKDARHFISTPDSGSAPENYKFYLTGNVLTNVNGKEYKDITLNNWAGMKLKDTVNYPESVLRSDEHFPVYAKGVDVSVAKNAESADEAYRNVLKYTGAGIDSKSRPLIDQEVMKEAQTGKGYITGARPLEEATEAQKADIEKYNIHFVDYTGYYPQMSEKTIIDTDNDGMPDDWELERGLDPNDPTDYMGDYLGEGYNNIEYYINDLTVDAFPKGVVTISKTLKELSKKN